MEMTRSKEDFQDVFVYDMMASPDHLKDLEE